MITETSDPAPPRSSGRRRPSKRNQQAAAAAITAVAAVGAAFAGAQPTGTAGVDALLCAALGAGVALLASRSRRWPLFAPAAAALLLGEGWILVLAVAAAVAALVGASRHRRLRTWGAATGALAIQVLLRLPDIGFHGFTALVVVAAIAPVAVSAIKVLKPEQRKQVRKIALLAGGGVGIVLLAYGVLFIAAAADVRRGAEDARQGLVATRLGDTENAQLRFGAARESFSRADTLLGGFWTAPARAVPIVAQQSRALAAGAAEGERLSASAEDTVVAADYGQLRSTAGQFDVARIRAVAEPLDRSAEAIDHARRELRANRSPWLVAPLGEGLDDLEDELDETGADVDIAQDAVAVAPELLGGEGLRRYFVAFLTPAELRGGGGFMGSYAEVTADAGRLELVRSGSFRDLGPPAQGSGATVVGPEEYFRNYGRYDVAAVPGDAPFSPHFPYDAEVLAELYPQAGGAEVDGVISIDPIALAALLQITGPIAVPSYAGQTLNAGNAADFLLRTNYALFPDDAAQNDALSELVELTFRQLTTGDLPGPREVGLVMGPATDEGRVHLWSPRPEEQALFQRLGATGALPEPRPDHDFLTVIGQNGGNNKIDVYLRRSIDYDVTVEGDRLEATARITVRNEVPMDGSIPDYVISNTKGDPLGTNRMLLSVYTPHLLEGATLDGEPVTVSSQREVGYHLYSKAIVLPPGGSATFEVQLSGTLDVDDGYVLDLAPQPTVESDELSVSVGIDGETPTNIPSAPVIGRRRITVGG